MDDFFEPYLSKPTGELLPEKKASKAPQCLLPEIPPKPTTASNRPWTFSTPQPQETHL